MLHAKLNLSLSVPFFGLFQIISDKFCIVCTQTAFLIKKQKALGDFQIIFQIFFASFVPDLLIVCLDKEKEKGRPSILFCAHTGMRFTHDVTISDRDAQTHNW